MDVTSLRRTVIRNYRWTTSLLVFVIIIYLIYPSSDHDSSVKFVKSGFDWKSLRPHHPPSEPIHVLPSESPIARPKIQHNFDPQTQLNATIEARREAIKAAFVKGWRSYEKYAWMRDELRPLTAAGKDTFGGWGANLVDNLDTLWIMDLKDDFGKATRAVVRLDWDKTSETAVNMFETTIRHLGGLLSAYDLSGQQVLLRKAIELGDMLYTAFDTPNRMPPFWFDFEKAKTGTLRPDHHQAAASATTLSLEFTRLAQLSGDNRYYDAIARVTDIMYSSQNKTAAPGLWPVYFDLVHGDLTSDHTFSVGALSDSMYEYVLKMHLLLGGLESKYETMYRTTIAAIKDRLLFRPMTPDNRDILVAGDLYVEPEETRLHPESQHLSCFVGGMFALGAKVFDIPDHMTTAAQLTDGCVWAYSSTPSGIMPEIYSPVQCPSHEVCAWNETEWRRAVEDDHSGIMRLDMPRGFRHVRDSEYILRPEALESVFYMYRTTGREQYRDIAWTMFEAINAVTSTPYGNAAIDNVLADGKPTQRDSMEVSYSTPLVNMSRITLTPHVELLAG